MHRLSPVIVALLCAALSSVVLARPPAQRAGALRLEVVDREPPEGREAPDADDVRALREAVAAASDDREPRFALVRGLMAAGRLDEALDAARAWRAIDAYNLVVVRLIGDIYAELGDAARARRVYSAVVELLPEDAQAQHALVSVLKQAGDLEAAYDRLSTAARLRPEDARIAFELGDVAERVGRGDEAADLFGRILADPAAPEPVRLPARLRLANVLSGQRRAALAAGDGAAADRLSADIAALGHGAGDANDIKIFLTWDTNGSDVDLWVTNPAGQKVYYERKKGRFGGELFHDVTTGYGPEVYTAGRAQPGTYGVRVNYYASEGRAFAEVRGEVVVVLAEGTDREERHVLPYRLFAPKQTVTVARIEVR